MTEVTLVGTKGGSLEVVLVYGNYCFSR